jgi:NAD(P)H dehydrogenase (quinone)
VQVLVIYCHPVAESFAAAAHGIVLQTLAARGHEVVNVDLYAENFDPVMSRQERLDYQNTERNIRPVRKYDEQLATAEAIVLVYPAWWYGMPAMLKGYFDRVWLPGVAFDVTPDGRVLTERLQRIAASSSSRRMAGRGGWCVSRSVTRPARSCRAPFEPFVRAAAEWSGTFTTTWTAQRHAS